MTNIINSFIDNSVQCWGCGVFDRLFQIVSTAATQMYEQLTFLAMIIFVALFTALIVNAVYQNIKSGGNDPFYKKSILKVFINAIVVLGLLGAGVAVPKMVTRVTIEPAALVALTYTQALTQQDMDTVEEKVTYQPMEMADDGFFRPQLRDTIIMLMKTTITQFQSYMKLGVAIMDSAFTWKALLGIGALIKHIGLFFIGLYLFYGFFKLFVRFCFYFVDIIVAMAFFAFFFPMSLMLLAFDGAEHIPDVVKNVSKHISKDQIKKLINAIVALASCVLTYTIIMMVIAKFFSDPDETNVALMEKIMSGEVFEADLNDENLEALTLMSVTVLVYVLNFIYKQIPQITSMILGVFGVSAENQLSEKMADDALTLSKNVINTAVSVGKTIINGGEEKKS
ncbi:MAG: hypothetical protein IJ500_02725 [Alphaproteobacteria bacterium]|nr:hypothetical protein [Alphaproteobacteria bacterium]